MVVGWLETASLLVCFLGGEWGQSYRRVKQESWQGDAMRVFWVDTNWTCCSTIELSLRMKMKSPPGVCLRESR